MKNTILILMLLCTAFGAIAQNSSLKHKKTSVTGEKTLVVSKNQIELGENLEMKESEFELIMKNVGDKPIMVRRIATTAFIHPKVETGFRLLPDETKVVKMIHQPGETGQFLETAVIESDAVNTMEIVKVFGTIAESKSSLK